MCGDLSGIVTASEPRHRHLEIIVIRPKPVQIFLETMNCDSLDGGA